MTLEQASQRSVTDMKHDDVLKAALAHFLKHGYTGAAMADIARDADVSTATLYKYFRSKKELFTTIAMNEAVSADNLKPAAGSPKKMKNSCTMKGVLRISST